MNRFQLEIDCDGGERGFVKADADWMQNAIEKAFMAKYQPDPEDTYGNGGRR